MISIDDQTYQAIAAQLRDELTGKEFFNGQLEYDTEEFYSTLTCTLILRNAPRHGTPRIGHARVVGIPPAPTRRRSAHRFQLERAVSRFLEA